MNLEFARFIACELSDVVFELGGLSNAEFIDCAGIGTRLLRDELHNASLRRCRFKRADFRRSSFWQAVLEDCDLSQSAAAETAFIRTRAERVSFRAAGLLDTQLEGAIFKNCDFRQADLREGDAFDTLFEDSDLRDAQLNSRSLRGSTFVRCKFHGMTGKPKIEGEVTLIEPDLSPEGDGTQIVSAEEILRLWRA